MALRPWRTSNAFIRRDQCVANRVFLSCVNRAHYVCFVFTRVCNVARGMVLKVVRHATA